MKKIFLALAILFSAQTQAAEPSFEETWEFIQKTMTVHSYRQHVGEYDKIFYRGAMLNNPEINDPCYAIIVRANRHNDLRVNGGISFQRDTVPVDFSNIDFEKTHKIYWAANLNQLYINSGEGNLEFIRSLYWKLPEMSFTGGELLTVYEPSFFLTIPVTNEAAANKLIKAFKHLSKLCQSPF